MPAADPDAKIPCPTPQMLQDELAMLADVLEPPEKEETWEKFERALIRFAGITRGGGYKHVDVYVRGVGPKGVGLKIADCTLAPRLAHNFAPLVNLYLPPLVRLLARPNKVYLKRSDKCLSTIISHCQLPSILPHLRTGLDDRNDQCKRACAAGLDRAVAEWPREMWTDKEVDTLEGCVRKMATDKDAEVRKVAKRVWGRFMQVWPERVEDFSAPLTPTIRRYLDIAAAPNGATKPKAAAAGRPARPAATLSSSTGPSRPAHQRVAALGGRAEEAVKEPTSSMAPGRHRQEPAAAAHDQQAAIERPLAIRQERAPIASALSAGPSRPVNLHARSVSHAALSTLTGPAAMTLERAPLPKPVRLPTSSSVMTLPTDEAPRRFAPPARILRPLPLDERDEPGPRGPSRPPLGQAAANKRLPGQAQRRVVTGPAAVEASAPAAPAASIVIHSSAVTPAPPPRINRSVRDRIKDMERDIEIRGSPSPTRRASSVEPAHVPLPPDSPAFAQPAHAAPGSPLRSASPSMENDGPLVKPVDLEHGETEETTRSQEQTETVPPDVAGPEDDGRLEADLAPDTVAEQELSLPAHAETSTQPESHGSTAENVSEQVESSADGDAEATLEPALVMAGTGEIPESVTVTESAVPAAAASTAAVVIVETAAKQAEAATSAPGTDHSTRPPSSASTSRAASSANAPTKAGAAAKPSVKPALPSRRPAVPTARVVSRVPSGPAERKSFRPVSKLDAKSTPASPVKTAALKPAVPRVVSAKPAVPKVAAAATTKAAPSVAAAPALSVSAVSAPLPKPGAGYVSNLTKPTAATAARSASATQPKPAAAAAPRPLHRVASAATIRAQVTLPPTKRERLQLKPPLPSFRPGPRRPAAAAPPASPKPALTSAASSRAPSRAGVARVRPEAIALPASPVPRAALELALPASPGPTAAQFADKQLTAKVRPDAFAAALPPSPSPSVGGLRILAADTDAAPATITLPPSPSRPSSRPSSRASIAPPPRSPIPKSPLARHTAPPSPVEPAPAPAAAVVAVKSPVASVRSRHSTSVSSHRSSIGSPLVVAAPRPASPYLVSLNAADLPPSPPAMSGARMSGGPDFASPHDAAASPTLATPHAQTMPPSPSPMLPYGVTPADLLSPFFDARAPSTVPPLSDDNESDTDGVSFRAVRPAAAASPADTTLDHAASAPADLIEFSAPSRPRASAPRHDVSTPGRGAEASLKAAMSPPTPALAGSPGERRALTPRDANASLDEAF